MASSNVDLQVAAISPKSSGGNLADRTVDYDDSSSCSSDDDAGVFLGTHTDAETRFLAKLSQSRRSPSPPSTPARRHRRQSRLVSRLRKDSTEFHRRQTMIFPIVEKEEAPEEQDDRLEDSMMQERYQREVSVLQISPSALASASKHSPRYPQQRLSLAFGSSRCLESDSSDDDDDSCETSLSVSSSDHFVDSVNSESDKENELIAEDVRRREDGADERLFSLTGCTDLDGNDVDPHFSQQLLERKQQAEPQEEGWESSTVLGLDLGGLSLQDFGDAEAEDGTEMLESLARLAIMYNSDDDDIRRDLPAISTSSPDESLSAEKLDRLTIDNGDTPPEAGDEEPTISQDGPTSAQDNIELCEGEAAAQLGESPSRNTTPATDARSPACLVPCEDAPASEVLSEADSDLDPLPVPRAGPSMAAFAHFSPIRATASPFRSPPLRLPTADVLSPPPQPQPILTPDENLQSPSRTPLRAAPPGTPMTTRTPRQLGPLPTTATPCQLREEVLPMADRTVKILKSQTSVPSAVKQTEAAQIPVKDKTRALAVRGQLDAAFTHRAGKMGPPQRTVSASSSLSSSSSSSRAQSRLEGSRVPRQAPSKADYLPRKAGTAGPRPTPPATLAKSVGGRGLPTSKRPAPSLSSSLARPQAQSAKVAVPPPRQALAPRSLAAQPAKKPIERPIASKATRPVEIQPNAIAVDRHIAGAVTTAAPNPLKRPYPTGGFAVPARQSVQAVAGPRPALGLPSRLVWDASSGRHAQTFHVGAPPENTMARIAARSPARQGSHQLMPGTPSGGRVSKLGTPSRSATGTPRTIRAKPSFQMLASASTGPKVEVAEDSVAITDGPPAAATRHASERQEATPQAEEPHRGSSADHEDVSMLLPEPPSSQSTTSSSPKKQSESPPKRVSPRKNMSNDSDRKDEAKPSASPCRGDQPRRTVRPPAGRSRSVPSTPAAPWMSGKELKTTTDRNTMRNQVYLCAIDRQIVRKNGPRPPSPTSKIRTTADRDEEEKKKSREHRAKRRARDSDNNTSRGNSPDQPRIEKVERLRGPGDDEDWRTPARPTKKAKIGVDKSVKWDKGLIIIRDDGSGVCPPPSTDAEEPMRSCLREEAKVKLDKHGNLISHDRPTENLKRSKVVVTAVFYDGEEPVPVPDFPTVQDTSGSNARGKKKK